MGKDCVQSKLERLNCWCNSADVVVVVLNISHGSAPFNSGGKYATNQKNLCQHLAGIRVRGMLCAQVVKESVAEVPRARGHCIQDCRVCKE